MIETILFLEKSMFTKNFIICDKSIVLKADGTLPEFSDLQSIKDSNSFSDFFEEKQFGIRVLGLDSVENLPENFIVMTLREYFAAHDEEETFPAFRAKGLLSWRASTKFCGYCGKKLYNHNRLTARKCPNCKNIVFPRISPCIIVLINKGEQILLAKHTYRNQDMYACIAGFMESGESAEHAVAREIKEETGLTVRNIQYRGSQSWPFPDQLMLGFTAEYESGDIVLQKEELADARWFDRDKCPLTPKPGSIAYRLIHQEY